MRLFLVALGMLVFTTIAGASHETDDQKSHEQFNEYYEKVDPVSEEVSKKGKGYLPTPTDLISSRSFLQWGQLKRGNHRRHQSRKKHVLQPPIGFGAITPNNLFNPLNMLSTIGDPSKTMIPKNKDARNTMGAKNLETFNGNTWNKNTNFEASSNTLESIVNKSSILLQALDILLGKLTTYILPEETQSANTVGQINQNMNLKEKSDVFHGREKEIVNQDYLTTQQPTKDNVGFFPNIFGLTDTVRKRYKKSKLKGVNQESEYSDPIALDTNNELTLESNWNDEKNTVPFESKNAINSDSINPKKTYKLNKTSTQISESENPDIGLNPNQTFDQSAVSIKQPDNVSTTLDSHFKNKTEVALPVMHSKYLPHSKIGDQKFHSNLISYIMKDVQSVDGKYVYVPSNLTLVRDSSNFNYSVPRELDVLISHLTNEITKNMHGNTPIKKEAKVPVVKKSELADEINCSSMEDSILDNGNVETVHKGRYKVSNITDQQNKIDGNGNSGFNITHSTNLDNVDQNKTSQKQPEATPRHFKSHSKSGDGKSNEAPLVDIECTVLQ